jgi:glycosyltransferase domain-containing protein
MDFSVVVISRNRPRYLDRLFGYFVTEGLDAPIFLGDASAPDEAEEVATVCARYGTKLDIRRTTYEFSSPPMGRLRREFDKVETAASIWVGDDDLVSPRVLREAADRLARSPECAAVTGRSVTFTVTGDGPLGKVSGLGDYLQKGYPQALASERLLAQAKDGTALTYSLRRTAVVQRVLGDIDDLDLPDDALGYYLFELLDGMLTALAGQVDLLDDVMMARQVHPGSTAAAELKSADRLGLLVRSDWPDAFGRAQDLVAGRLSGMQTGLVSDEARETAGSALWIRVRAKIDKELGRRIGKRGGASLGVRAAAALVRLRSGRVLGARGGGELGRMMQAVECFPAAGGSREDVK